jgi:DNA-binding CsgD family transcriptional regulator
MLFELSPRRREIVLHLWSGLTQKEVASCMGVRSTTVRQTIGRIAALLPGRGSNLQKIMLWRSEVILAALPEVTKMQLKPLLAGQKLSTDALPANQRGAA